MKKILMVLSFVLMFAIGYIVSTYSESSVSGLEENEVIGLDGEGEAEEIVENIALMKKVIIMIEEDVEGDLDEIKKDINSMSGNENLSSIVSDFDDVQLQQSDAEKLKDDVKTHAEELMRKIHIKEGECTFKLSLYLKEDLDGYCVE